MYSLLIKGHCVVPRNIEMEVGEAHIPFTSCCYWPNLKIHGILRKVFNIECFEIWCWNDITKSTKSCLDLLWFNLISISSFLLMFFLDLKHILQRILFETNSIYDKFPCIRTTKNNGQRCIRNNSLPFRLYLLDWHIW